MKRAEENLYTATKRRDQHIGSNLDRAEVQIKEKYPHLREKDSLNLAVRIGAAHQPEKYTLVPTNLHPHIPKLTDHLDRFRINLYKDGQLPKKFDDDLKLLLLRAGVTVLNNSPEHPLKLTSEQISTMSLGELTLAVRKAMPS